ncbi:MAG: toll/interleukin-1 receptor domain-containing protein [Anaerolineae bacterium]
MRDAEKSVFISYRRSVSRHLARSIALDLRAHGYDVFFDVDTVDSGEFDRIVLQQIARRTHFVLVLSRGALERCADEGDWLRREIETALHLKRNIVPVFEANFSFSAEARHLPESIRDLPRFNGIPIYHFYFDAAMETLRNRFLKEPEHAEES